MKYKGSRFILIDVLSLQILRGSEVKHDKSQAGQCPNRGQKQSPYECKSIFYHMSQLFLPLPLFYLIFYVVWHDFSNACTSFFLCSQCIILLIVVFQLKSTPVFLC